MTDTKQTILNYWETQDWVGMKASSDDVLFFTFTEALGYGEDEANELTTRHGDEYYERGEEGLAEDGLADLICSWLA